MKAQPLLPPIVKGKKRIPQSGHYPNSLGRGIITSMHRTINAYPCQRHDIHDPTQTIDHLLPNGKPQSRLVLSSSLLSGARAVNLVVGGRAVSLHD